MPKPIRFIYEKKEAFRDAFYFIIICEGENREPRYFEFFNGISSRVKIVAVPSSGGNSSPNHLIDTARKAVEDLDATSEKDRVWFVVDTDRWGDHLHEIRRVCSGYSRWDVAQSNPCFEVWLYFHVKSDLPDLGTVVRCRDWKLHVSNIIKGGFNSDHHPIAIETAISNAELRYKGAGYFPLPGSTQVWQLGQDLLPLIRHDLDERKGRIPGPEIRRGE